jgi:hypothetical protein
MKEFLESVPSGTLNDVPALAFDTRYHSPRLFTGSAAKEIGKLLSKRLGCRLLAHPESFFDQRAGARDKSRLRLCTILRSVPPSGDGTSHRRVKRGPSLLAHPRPLPSSSPRISENPVRRDRSERCCKPRNG